MAMVFVVHWAAAHSSQAPAEKIRHNSVAVPSEFGGTLASRTIAQGLAAAADPVERVHPHGSAGISAGRPPHNRRPAPAVPLTVASEAAVEPVAASPAGVRPARATADADPYSRPAPSLLQVFRC
jgi:hypothetical protein